MASTALASSQSWREEGKWQRRRNEGWTSSILLENYFLSSVASLECGQNTHLSFCIRLKKTSKNKQRDTDSLQNSLYLNTLMIIWKPCIKDIAAGQLILHILNTEWKSMGISWFNSILIYSYDAIIKLLSLHLRIEIRFLYMIKVFLTVWWIFNVHPLENINRVTWVTWLFLGDLL